MKEKHVLGWQLITSLVVLLVSFSLSGCANTRNFQHGISMRVHGERSVYDVRVQYGKELIRFQSVTYPGSGGLWNGPMSVPEHMKVTWFVGGHPQEATVPLKTKLSRIRPLANWVLHFYGERLEVFRQDNDPENPVGRHPLVKIYS